MPDRLRERIAIVVGAGSAGEGWGNGRATAVAFAREGARVICADRDLASAERTAALIKEEGLEGSAVRCDATREREVAQLIEDCVARYGRVDVLHNNVGIAHMGDVIALTEAAWDQALAINLKSAIFAMKHTLPIMERQGKGAIVNVSSVTAIRYVGVAYASYYATKAALSHLTKTTAAQYARQNIRVNAILPGLMKTPLVQQTAGLAGAFGLPNDPSQSEIEEMWRRRDARVPMGHMGDAWDVAAAAVFLASDEARYITGIELVVDGGLSLGVP